MRNQHYLHHRNASRDRPSAWIGSVLPIVGNLIIAGVLVVMGMVIWNPSYWFGRLFAGACNLEYREEGDQDPNWKSLKEKVVDDTKAEIDAEIQRTRDFVDGYMRSGGVHR